MRGSRQNGSAQAGAAWAARLGVIGIAAAAVGCGESSLEVGDAVPQISAERWIKGEPQREVASGRVTLVEFWATWCGPCIAAMPHISELAETRGPRGLDVIAVSIDQGEDAASLVEEFVEDRPEIMSFDVMLDDGAMARDWFRAAGRRGIPSSFVVDREGRLAWMGHPMQTNSDGENELELVIDRLLADASNAPG